MGGNDAADTSCFGGSADRAEVLRVLQAVQHQEHGVGAVGERGPSHGLQLPVFARAHVGHDALVRLRVRDVVELASVGWLDGDLARSGELPQLPQSRLITQPFGE